jgi:rhomboid protease GluP
LLIHFSLILNIEFLNIEYSFMEQELVDEQPEEKRENKSPFHALIPKGDYFFTPIILSINILVFVLMVFSGVHWMTPSSQSLIDWGANQRSLTIGGEPWRLFTSMFLHFGIIHLAVNMLALYSLGRMVEPFVGKWRFLALYIFAGLGGSAASLWWHAADNVPSAGASAAIFGLFGIFGALLTTDLIRKDVRKELLASMGRAILLNLVIGFALPGIDNAAHIGGLLTGAAGGYLCYFDLRDWYALRIQKYRGVILTGLLTAGAIVFFWMMLPDKFPSDSETMWKRIEENEEKAITFWGSIDSTTTADAIHQNFTKRWDENITTIDSFNTKKMNPEFVELLPDLRRYMDWMNHAGKYYERSITENRPDFKDSSAMLMNKAGAEISRLKLKQSQDK